MRLHLELFDEIHRAGMYACVYLTHIQLSVLLQACVTLEPVCIADSVKAQSIWHASPCRCSSFGRAREETLQLHLSVLHIEGEVLTGMTKHTLTELA